MWLDEENIFPGIRLLCLEIRKCEVIDTVSATLLKLLLMRGMETWGDVLWIKGGTFQA